MVGRTFVPIKDGDFDLIKNTRSYHLTLSKNQKIIVDGKVSEYKIELDYDTMFNLSRVKLSDAKTPDYLEVFIPIGKTLREIICLEMLKLL